MMWCDVTVDEEVLAKQLAEKQRLDNDVELLNQIIDLSAKLSTSHEVNLFSLQACDL